MADFRLLCSPSSGAARRIGESLGAFLVRRAARLAEAVFGVDNLMIEGGIVVASESHATGSGSVAVVVSLTSEAVKGRTRLARTAYAGLLRAFLRRDVAFLRAAAAPE